MLKYDLNDDAFCFALTYCLFKLDSPIFLPFFPNFVKLLLELVPLSPDTLLFQLVTLLLT